MKGNFRYLNVRSLLNHYSNPSDTWHEGTRSMAQTELDFYIANNLLVPDHGLDRDNIDDVIIEFYHFNEEGKAFIMSQSVERWRGACDRKGGVEIWKDPKGLERRLKKFREQRSDLATERATLH